jgi:outer membrane protein assembly factor BamB/predicted Ser/Thr protein kinase
MGSVADATIVAQNHRGLRVVNVSQQEPAASRIGRYEVIASLGRGGMGVVYRAYDSALDRPIALKLLAPDLARQPRLVGRLRREAISAARLHHPNIAILYEFGEDDGAPFLAMEYVPGVSLRQLLESGPLPTGRVLSILGQIAEALDYAHAMGVVHRDVKPSNILVGDADHAVLIDFGLAEMTEDSLVTADNTVLGTPHYMSPEQAAGRRADGQGDQYALAAVAYELLTGIPPFHGRAVAAVIHAHIYEPPAPPTERFPALPGAVNAVLLRALAKKPADRYPSLAAFVDDLRAALEGAPRRSRAGRWALALAIGITVLAGLLALAFAQFGVGAAQGDKARSTGRIGIPLAQEVIWTYDPGLAGDSAPLAIGDTVAIGTLDGAVVGLNAANGSVRWRKDGSVSAYGEPSAGAGQLFVGNDAGDIFCLDPDTGAVHWQRRLAGAVQQPPLRNNDRLIVSTVNGFIYVLHAGNDEVLWGRRVADNPLAPVVGADSIFVSAGHTLLALDWNTGTTRWSFEAPSAILTQPVFAGDMVLIGTSRGVLYGIRADSGQKALEYQARGEISAAPAVSADAIFVADRSGMLVALHPDTASHIWQFQTSTSTAIAATPLLADGKLLFGTSGGGVYTLDARSGRELATVQLDSSVASSLALGADYIYVRANRVYALGS